MKIDEIKGVLARNNLRVVECNSASGAFLGYKVVTPSRPIPSGFRSLKSLQREAKRLSKRGVA